MRSRRIVLDTACQKAGFEPDHMPSERPREVVQVERGGHISKMKVTKKLSLAGIRTPSAKPEEKEGDRADDRCVDRELGAVPHRQAVCDYLNATCLADRHIDVHVANPNVPGYLCSGLATGEQQHAPAEELGRHALLSSWASADGNCGRKHTIFEIWSFSRQPKQGEKQSQIRS